MAANGSVPAYTVYSHADLQDTQGPPCSVSSNFGYAAAVQICTTLKQACCIRFGDLQLSSTVVRHVDTKDACVYQALCSAACQQLHSIIDLIDCVPTWRQTLGLWCAADAGSIDMLLTPLQLIG